MAVFPFHLLFSLDWPYFMLIRSLSICSAFRMQMKLFQLLCLRRVLMIFCCCPPLFDAKTAVNEHCTMLRRIAAGFWLFYCCCTCWVIIFWCFREHRVKKRTQTLTHTLDTANHVCALFGLLLLLLFIMLMVFACCLPKVLMMHCVCVCCA